MSRNSIKKILGIATLLIVAWLIVYNTEDEPQSASATIQGNVKEVIDGDTLVLTTGEKVRLIGINAPESDQPYGREATEELIRLTENKTLTFKSDKTEKDAYGRTLAYAYVGDTFLNDKMIQSGLALVETVPPNEKYEGEFMDSEIDAQKNCRGLWEGLCVKGSATNNCLSISEIHQDAQGDDAKNLNDEWITLANSCIEDIPLDGYLLKDRSASNSYFFKNKSILANSTLTLYSGCGEDTGTSIYWQCPGKRSAVWNNASDQGYLYDKYGKLTATLKY